MTSQPNLEETIGFALHHSSYLFKSGMKAMFSDHGLNITPEEMIILFLIKEGGTDQAELIQKSLKDKTNITRILTRMENKKLIHRKNHAKNGRQQIVYITKTGQKTRVMALPLVQEMAGRALGGINARDIEITTATLNKISKNLK